MSHHFISVPLFSTFVRTKHGPFLFPRPRRDWLPISTSRNVSAPIMGETFSFMAHAMQLAFIQKCAACAKALYGHDHNAIGKRALWMMLFSVSGFYFFVVSLLFCHFQLEPVFSLVQFSKVRKAVCVMNIWKKI